MTTSCFGLSPLLQAASIHLGRPVTGEVRWLHLATDELDRLTESDRELVQVVTGETLPREAPESGVLVSFFVLQLAMDRAAGPLEDGREVGIRYVEDVFDAYEASCPDGNPFSGDLFDLALAFLVGRDLASFGPDAVVA